MEKTRKTRPFQGNKDFTCPVHKLQVVMTRKKLIDDDTGEVKYGGDFMCCPSYGECKYWVSPFNHYGATVANIEEV